MSDQSPVFESPAFPEPDEDDLDLYDEDDLDDDADELDDDGEDDGEDDADDEGDADELDDEVDAEVGPAAGGGASRGHAGSEAGDEANRVPGSRASAVLEHIARSLVDDPDAVEVTAGEGRGGLMLSLRVAPGDMGRVIGKRGRIAQALRAVVRAAGARDGTEASVDIVD